MSEIQIETSPTIGKIAEALAKAQSEMEDAAKDATNPHFKNKYSSLSAVRSAVRVPFAKNNLSYTQLFAPVGADSVFVATLLMHSSGEWLKSSMSLPVQKKDAQGQGSAISYGRRYELAAIAGIASDDDDDANAATNKPAAVDRSAPTQAPAAPTGVDVDALVKALDDAKDEDALARAELAVGRVKDKLSKKELERCIAARANGVRRLAGEQAAAQ